MTDPTDTADEMSQLVYAGLIGHGEAMAGTVLTLVMARLLAGLPKALREDAIAKHAAMALELADYLSKRRRKQ